MKDIEIRKALMKKLEKKYRFDQEILIIEELGLCRGEVRVDLAVVNGYIHGYEIKSEQDTLRRLPNQLKIFCRTLESITFVVNSKHLKNVTKIVPSWCGIFQANDINGRVELVQIRQSLKNPSLDPSSIVQLLWRDEALEILRERNLHKGVVSKPRAVLWNRLVEYLSIDELSSTIRIKLKSRQDWRVAPQPV